MEGFAAVLIIVSLAVIIFFIYFIFKILQFVITAVNLYKKIVNRQDAIIKLLLDIRDNTQNFKKSNSDYTDSIDKISNEEMKTFICENCNTEVPNDAKICPKCGAEFE